MIQQYQAEKIKDDTFANFRKKAQIDLNKCDLFSLHICAYIRYSLHNC